MTEVEGVSATRYSKAPHVFGVTSVWRHERPKMRSG